MEPAGKIEPQPWMTAPESAKVLAALSTDGEPARFVGGCVRDAVLGRPVKDIDIATPRQPDEVVAVLERGGIRVIPTGIGHGTVTAVIGPAHFEITTLRHDVETFGRHARVAFTDDWAADAARRDFTINALFCDADGTLYDPVGGLADLHAGRIRFVGVAAERIREDVLRLLRFFRFYAWYGDPPPDTEALEACRTMAPEIARLSAERVWSELRRLLLAPDPAGVLDLMAEWKVIEHVLAESRDRSRLTALCRIERRENIAPKAVRRLAAAIEADERAVAELAQRLRLSRAETIRLALLAAPDETPLPDMDLAVRRRLLYRIGADAFGDLVLLSWAALTAGGVGAADEDAWRDLWRTGTEWKPVSLPVAGRDALALGIPKGPAVGRLLAAVEQWWVENDFRPGRAACRKRLADLARRQGFHLNGDGRSGR